MVVDHIDGNSLRATSNRWGNMWICTRPQNGRNRRKNRRTTNEYKSIRHDKRIGKCHAKIRFKGKSIYLGSFDTTVEAARAYDRKAV